MDISRFKQQHVQILDGIAELRNLAHAGIAGNAEAIARKVDQLSQVVTRHLAVEDRILYPAVQKANTPELARMGENYQNEMQGIANAYIAFSRRWSDAKALRDTPEAFRREANTVLKTVFTRMQKENHEFYPAVEAM